MFTSTLHDLTTSFFRYCTTSRDMLHYENYCNRLSVHTIREMKLTPLWRERCKAQASREGTLLSNLHAVCVKHIN